MFELKKYRGVIFHKTEEGYKIWRGIDLSFQNWHKEDELCFMKMKNDTAIEEELTCRFKIDMRSFTNFDLSTRKSKKFVFQLAPCDQTIYCLSCKSTEELSFMTLKRYTNSEEKLTCGSKKDLRNLANFHHST